MPTLRVGVSLPMFGELAPPGYPGPVAAARHVESLGLDVVGLADVIVGDGTPALDSVPVAAAVAASTELVRIEFGVLALPTRPAPWLATQVATLQQLSDDRITLGVGSGGFPNAPFWSALGVEPKQRLARTDAALEVLPGLIAGVPTALGPDLAPVTLAPAATVPPIVVGGGAGRTTFDRIAAYGDGWAPSLTPPDELASAIGELRDHVGPRDSPPRITYGTHGALGTNGAVVQAGERFAQQVAEMLGTADRGRAVLLNGGPSQIAADLAAYAEAGTDTVIVGMEGPGWMRQVELLAEARSHLPEHHRDQQPPG